MFANSFARQTRHVEECGTTKHMYDRLDAAATRNDLAAGAPLTLGFFSLMWIQAWQNRIGRCRNFRKVWINSAPCQPRAHFATGWAIAERRPDYNWR